MLKIYLGDTFFSIQTHRHIIFCVAFIMNESTCNCQIKRNINSAESHAIGHDEIDFDVVCMIDVNTPDYTMHSV